MPILVPDLVRRSVRSSTVAASRAADEEPPFTSRAKAVHRSTRSRLEHRRIAIERVAGQEEADGVEFAP